MRKSKWLKLLNGLELTLLGGLSLVNVSCQTGHLNSLKGISIYYLINYREYSAIVQDPLKAVKFGQLMLEADEEELKFEEIDLDKMSLMSEGDEEDEDEEIMDDEQESEDANNNEDDEKTQINDILAKFGSINN